MKFMLDTSVVIRLLTGNPPEQLAATTAFLNEAGSNGSTVHVTDLVVAETYYALQHHFGLAKSDALWGLSQLFSGWEIQSAGHAAEVLSQPGLESAKPGFVDTLIHAESSHSSCHWVTFEKSGAKLPDTIVLKKA